MADGLGKRVTQVPGFEWKPGMVSTGGIVARVFGSKVMVFEDCGLKAGANLDLDHPANTGFLLELLFQYASVEITTLGGDKLAIAVTMRQEFMYRSYPSKEGEHVNHALARALVDASEAECS